MSPLFSALPVTNAQITLIAGGGFSEDYDSVEGSDEERWSGLRPAYVDETLMTTVAGNQVDEVAQTRLIVHIDVGHHVVRGDTVTYDYEGVEHVRRVRNVARHVVAGEVTLTLEDE